jgi:hypothetical protein
LVWKFFNFLFYIKTLYLKKNAGISNLTSTAAKVLPRSTLFPNQGGGGGGNDPNTASMRPGSGANNNGNGGNAPGKSKYRSYRYRVWQCKIYNLLERPRGLKAGLYHVFV